MTKYTLCCSIYDKEQAFISSDNKNQLMRDAYPKLKAGYVCFILNNETGEQSELELKESKDESRNS